MAGRGQRERPMTNRPTIIYRLSAHCAGKAAHVVKNPELLASSERPSHQGGQHIRLRQSCSISVDFLLAIDAVLCSLYCCLSSTRVYTQPGSRTTQNPSIANCRRNNAPSRRQDQTSVLGGYKGEFCDFLCLEGRRWDHVVPGTFAVWQAHWSWLKFSLSS